MAFQPGRFVHVEPFAGDNLEGVRSIAARGVFFGSADGGWIDPLARVDRTASRPSRASESEISGYLPRTSVFCLPSKR